MEEKTCWLFYGTFMRTGEILLEMAEKYRGRIQFAFKPHPNLHYTLCQHPQWGKQRTDAFYAKWREMPNTQFEDGAYADLFMQSDAMIHDCGSFIQEYLFADKPCMYLKDPENRQEYSAISGRNAVPRNTGRGMPHTSPTLCIHQKLTLYQPMPYSHPSRKPRQNPARLHQSTVSRGNSPTHTRLPMSYGGDASAMNAPPARLHSQSQ